MHVKLATMLVLGVVFGTWSCGSEDTTPTGSDGVPGSNGLASGLGGAGIGGDQGLGGLGMGGAPRSGGAGIGGAGVGGAPGSGGAGVGGSGVGGSGVGGDGTGGDGTGGDGTGGDGTGGDGTGGDGTGGDGTGGDGTGGDGTGGDGTGGGISVDPCTQTTPLSGGEEHCGSSGGGRVGDYSWSIWAYASGGCITVYDVDAAFSASWNESGGFLAGVGLVWDQTQTYDQLGAIYADYAYTRTGTGGGYSYIGIYGWSVDPLHEYYIVDDYYGEWPPNVTWGDGAQQGEFEVDGGTYRIFTHTQVEQPSIEGTQTFVQFYSVRQQARQCGRISVTAHYEQWAQLGMNLGYMHEAKILVEIGGGVGSIDYTYATFTVE